MLWHGENILVWGRMTKGRDIEIILLGVDYISGREIVGKLH